MISFDRETGNDCFRFQILSLRSSPHEEHLLIFLRAHASTKQIEKGDTK